MSKIAPRNDRMWDNLKELYLSLSAYTAVPAALAPLTRNQVLFQAMPEDTQQRLLGLMECLGRDVPTYARALSDIFAYHNQMTGSSRDGDDLMKGLDLYERYVNWAESYQSVILPNIADVTDIYIAAGAPAEQTAPLQKQSNIANDIRALATSQSDQFTGANEA